MRAATESRRPSRWWTAGIAAITVMMAGMSAVRAGETCPPPPPPAPDCGTAGAANTHAARAYSLSLGASVLGIGIGLGPVPDTGELPSGGGTGAATLIQADGDLALILLPKQVSLDASILHNTTFGSGNTSTAYSSVTDLSLSVNNTLTNTSLVSVSAGVLQAQSTVKCVSRTRTVEAAKTGASIANLAIKVLGIPLVIPVNAPANTGITLPSALKLLAKGTIMLNEQKTVNGRQIVNALHINLELLGLINAAKIDLVISHAEANTTCGGGSDPDSCTCKARDFVTGGGQFPNGSGGKSSFSINGRSQDSNGPNGHLNIVDHGTRDHIKATTLEDYQMWTGAPDDRGRKLIFSDCTSSLSGISQRCWIDIEDNDTSGGGADQFGASPYYGLGPILRGNIVLHKPSCGTGGSSGGSSGGSTGGGKKGGGRK